MEGNDNQDYFERTIIQIIGISYRITEFERQPVTLSLKQSYMYNTADDLVNDDALAL